MLKLFKGKPSKIEKVFAKGEQWTADINVKPPSTASFDALILNLAAAGENDDADAIKRMAEWKLDIIICCACDTDGLPIWNKDDKTDLAQVDKIFIDQLFYESLDISGMSEMRATFETMFKNDAPEDNEKK